MKFQEIKTILKGYKEYFYTMLSCEIELIYRKQYKEFIFYKLENKNNASKTLLIFEIGDLDNVKVKILNYSEISYYFEDRYKGRMTMDEQFNEATIYIDSTKRIHYLFTILEQINFFNSRRWL